MTKLYSIFDDKGGFYSPVFQARSDAEAERMFTISMLENWQYRHDYHLTYLGTFNEDTAVIHHDKPTNVLDGSALVHPDQETPIKGIAV